MAKTEREKELEDKVCELKDDLKEARNEIGNLEERVADLSDDLQNAKNKNIRLEEEATSAVHIVLDHVERPVGTLHCTIPPSPSASRAILALFDAVDRWI